ncbi:MAG: tRNA glutamyl-Q(34) synthetase GluQRS [Erythrobacter sp.]
MIVTRFAPSPNGHLHLGHAFSAIHAHDLAREAAGKFLLRIEDIDGHRSKSELADTIRRDIEWLGLEWEEVPAQSNRLETYREAAQRLTDEGLLYPCICTRSDISEASHRSGPDGPIYPGTCKKTPPENSLPAALRLNFGKALSRTGPISWRDTHGHSIAVDPSYIGDVVLVRKDLPSSYHLAVTLDDAADGVTHVTRGSDLIGATHVHRMLQELLGLPVPVWDHHPLLLDQDGRKLAKRRNSPPLADRRASGEDGRFLADQLRQRKFPSGIVLEMA